MLEAAVVGVPDEAVYNEDFFLKRFAPYASDLAYTELAQKSRHRNGRSS